MEEKSKNSRFGFIKNGIGEVVIIVIGILIGLALDDWKTYRDDRKKESRLLIEMASNLEDDLEDLQKRKQETEANINANKRVLAHIESHMPMADSLKRWYGEMFGSTTLRTKTQAYGDLNSVGSSLVEDDSTRWAITDLYLNKYPYLHLVEFDVVNKMQWEILAPQLISNTSNVLSPNAQPWNIESLQSDHDFKETIRMTIALHQYLLTEYAHIDSSIHMLQKRISIRLEALVE